RHDRRNVPWLFRDHVRRLPRAARTHRPALLAPFHRILSGVVRPLYHVPAPALSHPVTDYGRGFLLQHRPHRRRVWHRLLRSFFSSRQSPHSALIRRLPVPSGHPPRNVFTEPQGLRTCGSPLQCPYWQPVCKRLGTLPWAIAFTT